MRAARDDPFEALGLTARPDLTDDEVRAAWRRIAAVTHPDLPEGGDRERFARAAAGYAQLRTSYGRGEAYADLERAGSGPALGRPLGRPLGFAARVRAGRPAVLALRALIVVAVSAGSVAVAGIAPASLAIMTGALTWFIRTSRFDIASRG
jgi:curved DNA-binding protein CbpA